LKKEVSPHHPPGNIDEFLDEYIQAKNANALSRDNFARLSDAFELHPSSQSEIMLRKK
jgi:hypothetical protein